MVALIYLNGCVFGLRGVQGASGPMGDLGIMGAVLVVVGVYYMSKWWWRSS